LNCNSTHFDVTCMFYQYAWYMNKLETFIFRVCFTMFSSTYTNQKPIVSLFFNKIVITNYKDFFKMIICNSHQTKTFEGSNCSIMSQKCPCIWLFNLCLLLEYLFLIIMVNCVCVCVCVSKKCHFQMFLNHFTCLLNNKNIGYNFLKSFKRFYHSLNWLKIHSHVSIIYYKYVCSIIKSKKFQIIQIIILEYETLSSGCNFFNILSWRKWWSIIRWNILLMQQYTNLLWQPVHNEFNSSKECIILTYSICCTIHNFAPNLNSQL
jgi:hypothetical protein